MFLGERRGDGSGNSVTAIGDLDGDGLNEIAIGASGRDTPFDRGGAVYIFFSTSLGTQRLVNLEQADCTLLGEAADERLGGGLSPAGDIDGDGTGDLFVGSGSGVYVVPGSRIEAGASLWLDSSFLKVGGVSIYANIAPHPGGDLDGDGIPEFAFGCSGCNSSDGAIYVYRGSTLRLASGTLSYEDAYATIFGGSDSYNFYRPQFVGDFDGDDLPELLVADSGWSDGRGRIHIIPGVSIASGGFFGSPPSGATVITGVDTRNNPFRELAIGNIDGDSIPDLLAGDRGYHSDGQAFLFLGADLTMGSTLTVGDAHTTLLGETYESATGYAVAFTPDLDGDGLDDILIGAGRGVIPSSRESARKRCSWRSGVIC